MKASEKLQLQLKKEKERLKREKDRQKEKKLQEELRLQLREVRQKRSLFSIDRYKQFFKRTDHANSVVINMELKNGNHKTFYVAESGDSFKWNDRRYIFDPVLKYYNIDLKSYCYDFHEGFDLPIRRVFPINDTKTAISESGMIQTEYATNPSTLERFMNSSIIEMMLRGGAIDKMIRIVMIVIMITGILVLAHLLLYMNAQGYFNNLGI